MNPRRDCLGCLIFEYTAQISHNVIFFLCGGSKIDYYKSNDECHNIQKSPHKPSQISKSEWQHHNIRTKMFLLSTQI